ncbi:MAG TPA: hypothetical protein VLB27_12240, partial [candidate division Zixibacteria bacterium]|nr:hypothetical protein [candidate division Zixibacteria bacterium]
MTHKFKLSSLATLAALALTAHPTLAQSPDTPLRPKVYLGGGVASIQNPDALSRAFNSKFSLFGAVGFELKPGFEVRICGHYHDYNQ